MKQSAISLGFSSKVVLPNNLIYEPIIAQLAAKKTKPVESSRLLISRQINIFKSYQCVLMSPRSGIMNNSKWEISATWLGCVDAIEEPAGGEFWEQQFN